MQAGCGYTGRTLKIDLSQPSATIEELEPRLVQDYVGGAGINAALAHRLLRPEDDPFAASNHLIFGAGPLVGTMVPGAGKCNLTGGSPLRRFIGISGHGLFGMLKFAGFDHLIINGRSSAPVYLKIENDQVSFPSAAHLWGQDVFAASDRIWQETGPDFQVTCIGPAGENLVNDAGLITNKYAAMARTGLGAVMGAKNLKGIAIYGNGSIGVADRGRFLKIVKKLHQGVAAHPNLKEWRRLGTLISLETFAELGLYAAQNFQQARDASLLEDFDPEVFASQVKEGDVACLACPVGCKHQLRLKQGRFAGTSLAVSCMNAAMQSFGHFCLLPGWEEVARCAHTASALGLDFMSTGALIAFVMELYQRGLVSQEDLGGLEPRWGDGDAVRELMRMIAFREGIGDILAQGLHQAPARLGPGLEQYAMQSKGLGLLYDPRLKLDSTEIFSQFSNVRGFISNVSVAMVPRSQEQIRRYCQRIGLPPGAIARIVHKSGYNVARLNKWTEDVTTVLELLGVCQFPIFQGLPFELWAEAYSAVTGIERTPAELIRASERFWDLKRSFNLRQGAGPEDDSGPQRLFKQRVSFAGGEKPPLDQTEFQRLISDYYDERGWDPITGRPQGPAPEV